MSGFQNTIDLLGDEAVTKALVERTITEFNDNVITAVGQYAFYQCTTMTSVDLPNATSLGSYALNGCTKLATIILRSATLCSLGSTNAFIGTPFASGKSGGTLLFPRSVVESYKTATNWSVVIAWNANNRVLALEDYTVDGTITGEIDWNKLNGGAV